MSDDILEANGTTDSVVAEQRRRWLPPVPETATAPSPSEYPLTTAERLIVTGITARSELIRREIARLAKPLDDDSLLFRQMVAARTGLTVEDIDTAWEFQLGEDGTGAKLVRKAEAATEPESNPETDPTSP
jgi:hypothetical protein